MPLPALRFSPLSKDSDLSSFSCGHADLDEFLLDDSMECQQERLSVTRLAYIDSAIGMRLLQQVGCHTITVDSKPEFEGFYLKHCRLKSVYTGEN